jgi:cytochrome c-type biogenesis protein CcmE
MKPKHFRLTLLLASLVIGGIAIALMLRGMKESLIYFYMPSDLSPARLSSLAASGERVRLGGLVVAGSHGFDTAQQAHTFTVTDGTQSLPIVYAGLLPALFREGQGVIAEGQLTGDGTLLADRVLAKHDENYMPPELKKGLAALDRQKLQEGVVP